MQEGLPDARDDDESADRGEDGEDADRDRHRAWPLAVALVRVLLHELARLAAEHREVEAGGVEARQQGAEEPGGPERVAECVTTRERRRSDAVLRPEPGEDRDPHQRESADRERDVRARHDRPEAAHLADVLLAVQVVDDEAGRHEEQRLEEGVHREVEDRVAVRPDPRGHEHVADLRHRRVRDDALDVPLDERNDTRHQERDRAEDRGEVLDVWRRLEDRARAHEEVDARRDHRRRVNQRGHRRRALHRVGKPRVERDLRRLRERASEEAERDEVHRRRRERVDLAEDVAELERAGRPDEQHAGERERRVADRVHHERLLRRGDRLGLVVPEPDQEVRREADEPPADEHQQEVARLDEHEHREDEERHVGEVATLLLVALHVAHRVPDDQPADPRDDEHHRAREGVEEDLHVDIEVAGREPGVRGRDLLAIGRIGRPEPDEGDQRAAEGDERRQDGDPRRRPSGDPPPGERDRDRTGERREQADPRAGDHPRSALAWSTSSGTRRRAIATMRPSPIATSAAATAITASAKI